ncbi:MAG: hypothetical protein JOZ37_16690 [Actinobacteria bacterium]|nr:hypothetical protein [Actinomycetota bacterium]MBV9254165.1 hypothetical protein [Actinomycetota bacterium]MBV9665607.1 hypothetical protein [Actinomycetota bacterium]MBV9933955.1 hypothetical protein [Actinomycetota bacterium]
MKRTLALIAVIGACTLVACGGSKSSSSGTTTTTNADAYTTAYSVCLQFYNTDKMRNAEPAQITDDAADDVFVGLALQLKPAVAKDPRAWSKLNGAATRLRTSLMDQNVSDDKVEKAISDMADACQAAKKAPKSSTVQVPVTPSGSGSTTSSTPASTSTSGTA